MLKTPARIRRYRATALGWGESTARRLVRAAREAARQLVIAPRMSASDPRRIRLIAVPRPPVPEPALSVVVPDDGSQEGFAAAAQALLERQTARGFEVLFLNRAAGTLRRWSDARGAFESLPASSAEDVRRIAKGHYLALPTSSLGTLPATLLEVLTWVAVSENLKFVEYVHRSAAASPEPESLRSCRVVLTEKRFFDPVEGVDLAALQTSGLLRKDPVAGKRVWRLGLPAADAVTSANSRSGRFPLRTVGQYLVDARARRDFLPHGITELDGVFGEPPSPDPRPTVLVLQPFLAVGGAEKLTLDVVTRLGSSFRFLVVTLAPHDALLGNSLDAFSRVVPHVYTLGEAAPPQLFFSLLSRLIEAYEVRTLFNANGTTWFYETLPALRRRFPRLQIVNQLFDHRYGFVDYYGLAVAENVDRHIATNEAIAKTLRDERHVAEDRIDLIHHGIELSEFDPDAYGAGDVRAIRARLGVPDEKLLVTMAVRLHPQKRPADFIRLASRFLPRTEFFFLLIGGGPLEAEIDAMIADAGLPNLGRTGFFSPIADAIAASDIAVMMSEYEALPLYILSALAMRTPVVATDVGCIASVLSDGPCGFVVSRVGDLDQFEPALVRLAEPALRETMGRAGRHVVAERFSMDRAAREYAAVFSSSRPSG
jgi:glycosyltransferase involved in cell wall biosynthesis